MWDMTQAIRRAVVEELRTSLPAHALNLLTNDEQVKISILFEVTDGSGYNTRAEMTLRMALYPEDGKSIADEPAAPTRSLS